MREENVKIKKNVRIVYGNFTRVKKVCLVFIFVKWLLRKAEKRIYWMKRVNEVLYTYLLAVCWRGHFVSTVVKIQLETTQELWRGRCIIFGFLVVFLFLHISFDVKNEKSCQRLYTQQKWYLPDVHGDDIIITHIFK